MDHPIILKLQEHKEKLLFGFVVLLIVLIVMQAPAAGARLDAIDAEARAKATTAASLNSTDADRLIKQISETEQQRIAEIPDEKVSSLFFNDRSGFKPRKSSAWQLGAESFEKLPPLSLSFPGFPQLHDFDIPAGGSPAPERIIGYIPRDKRKVTLVQTEVNEFKDN